MELMNRVRRVLAELICDVRQWPTLEGELETALLRQRFISLGVALGVGRISPEEAAPRLAALELELLQCRDRLLTTQTIEAAALLAQDPHGAVVTPEAI